MHLDAYRNVTHLCFESHIHTGDYLWILRLLMPSDYSLLKLLAVISLLTENSSWILIRIWVVFISNTTTHIIHTTVLWSNFPPVQNRRLLAPGLFHCARKTLSSKGVQMVQFVKLLVFSWTQNPVKTLPQNGTMLSNLIWYYFYVKLAFQHTLRPELGLLFNHPRQNVNLTNCL